MKTTLLATGCVFVLSTLIGGTVLAVDDDGAQSIKAMCDEYVNSLGVEAENRDTHLEECLYSYGYMDESDTDLDVSEPEMQEESDNELLPE